MNLQPAIDRSQHCNNPTKNNCNRHCDMAAYQIVHGILGAIYCIATCALLAWFARFLPSSNIKARSPCLALVSGASSILIVATLLLDYIFSLGDDHRCQPSLWVSVLVFPLYCFPYILRGFRLAVIFRSDYYRVIFARFSRPAYINTMLVAATVVHGVFGMFLESMSSDYHNSHSGEEDFTCHLFKEWPVSAIRVHF